VGVFQERKEVMAKKKSKKAKVKKMSCGCGGKK
jgi:hypothetical protein